MPTLTSCPSCSKQLKVPDELLGRQVKCPACGTTFTATAAMPPGAPPPAPPVIPPGEFYGAPPGIVPPPSMTPTWDQPGAMPPRPAARSGLLAPGICLIIMAVLNVLLGLWILLNYVMYKQNPAEFRKQMEANIRAANEEEKKQQMEMVDTLLGPMFFSMITFPILLGVVAAPGAIQMVMGKKGTLGWLAAVANILPITMCCCAGIPVGIWAMMALKSAAT